MKRYLNYLLALTLLVSAAACGKKETPAPSEEPASAPDPAESAAPEASEKPEASATPEAQDGYTLFSADGFTFELPQDWFGQNAGSSTYFQNKTDSLLIGFSGSEETFSADTYDEKWVTEQLEEQNLLEEGTIEVSHGQPYDYTAYTFYDFESQVRVYHFRKGNEIKVLTIWNENGEISVYKDIVDHFLATLKIN
ncbi:MAG TPA: hypothetical protein DHW39_04920 [Erysipelotrichaceae bacterium]|nr:hypothetical protein [Erysipelotrichaceae bacterium]